MPRRILAGYDHSEEAAAGLRRAAGLALSARAELTVVHVAVPPPTWVGVGMLTMPLLDDVVDDGTSLVRDAVAALPPDIAVRWYLITGAEAGGSYCRRRCVRRALRRALERGDHDLLVLGTGATPGRIADGLRRMCPDRVVTAPYEPGDGSAAAAGAPQLRPSLSLE